MSTIENLPFDILLNFCARLKKQDVSSVLCTCNTMRALAHPDPFPLLKARILHWSGLDLYSALFYGLTDLVRFPIDERSGSELVFALIAACLCGNTKVMRLLLDHGADPNACVDGRRISPFFVSCSVGNVEVVRLLRSTNCLRLSCSS